MIYYLGEKVDLVEKKLLDQRNKNRLWKYGYDPEIDVVIISKDGTLGDIFDVNGLNIGLPKQPPKTNMVNNNLPVKSQKFVREELPQGLDAETVNEKRFAEYIDNQYKKREEGVWILLGGKPVWLVGVYWYAIQWVREGSYYPKLRIIQNELMIFWEACKADERCYGIDYVKNRRFGWSFLTFVELLYFATITENKLCGIISKKGKDAKKIFNRMVRAFKRLPPFFMPEWDGTSTPKTELVFSKPNKKRKAGEAVSTDEGLDTEISWHNTEMNAMDGDEIARSAVDEGGKFPKEVPFDEYLSILKTSHRLGSDIVGKMMVGSTVNAMNKGGREFKIVYDQSDPKVRNANNQTRSGLYRILIPAKYCQPGFFDEYGFSVVEDPAEPFLNDLGKMQKIGAWTFLSNELDALKGDPKKYNEQLRQFPDNERDAFRDEAGSCDFNLVHLLEQEEHNEFELEENEYGNNEVERGNFHWKDGIQDTEVIWSPDFENGRFWIAKNSHPPIEYRNKKVKKMLHGVEAWAPLNEHIGCFGVDPYNRSKTVDNRGSKGSIHLQTKFNTGPFPNDAFILEYIDRPLKVELFFEDVIMAMVYFSMPMLAELSNEQFLQTILNRGYRHFSLNNPFKLWKDLNPTEKEFGGVPPQDAKIGEQQFYAVEAYVEDYIGVARTDTYRPIGQMGYMPFSRTLNQWKEVDTTQRTKFDAYISSSLALLGNQKRTKPEVEAKAPILIPFKTYNNKGTVSVAV